MRRYSPVVISKMSRYIIAPDALKEIGDIISTINESNPSAASRWSLLLAKKFDNLATFPHTGRVREEFNTDAYVFPYGDYLIFYDITTDGINILHIIHGARDVPRFFIVTATPSESR